MEQFRSYNDRRGLDPPEFQKQMATALSLISSPGQRPGRAICTTPGIFGGVGVGGGVGVAVNKMLKFDIKVFKIS